MKRKKIRTRKKTDEMEEGESEEKEFNSRGDSGLQWKKNKKEAQIAQLC